MTLSAEDKDTLISLYLNRADKTLSDADWLVTEKRYEIAAGRYYYACFYAIMALFIHDGIQSKTHKGVQHAFLREYVNKNKVERTHGAWLSRMERLRELADYNCAYNINEEEVCMMSQTAHDIIAAVKKLIKV